MFKSYFLSPIGNIIIITDYTNLCGLYFENQKNIPNNIDELEENNNLFYSMMCRKSKVWNYEQEWRIWTYNSNVITGNFENPYMKIGNLKAKAVYLGERMPEYMRRVILEIAKIKQIPVYQMKSVMYTHCYKLKPILVQSN